MGNFTDDIVFFFYSTGGAIALAVTTGVFNGEALKDAAEDKGNVVVMDGLSDVNAVLRACGLA
jgi:hypothetical protein|tara:strand:+ start:168 stop:356 length:189 start_codon:yes stop_codon:yes gene_type:complete